MATGTATATAERDELALSLSLGFPGVLATTGSSEGEEEADQEDPAASPISTLSSVGGAKRDSDAVVGVDDEDGEGARKKLRLSKEQTVVLEEAFKEHSTLNPKQKMALAKQLSLRPRQVEVWFQNRRARTKLKQTEVECEYLKRWCEKLSDENQRLQREVAELRALKLLSPAISTGVKPPVTLTMCPSCERVASAAPAASGRYHDHPFTAIAGCSVARWAAGLAPRAS
ncbi:Homeobox-leucine zipper protein HAT3 [Apostasia shenzhenica]|uniref:Homeobox-leucine zipper protein HAT3 n=1 Tax=Apostasia shenzhenica TaxID=1088818 RepID=A0A2I0A3Y1_9ASPA|nr:Homeobox-leucine zipper protein HAT3 [Apostasia shenzhenica]